MSLDATVTVRRGAFTLDVDLTFQTGEIVAVLGPNGSGKSTLLRCLAGLTPIDSGRITLDDAVLDDPADEVLVAVEDRPVGFVFQDYLLFDHLSVIENVAFGLRARGIPKAEARLVAADLLERVALADRADASPRALSGGQAQRVALARALATRPAMLLLDEPLAALDAGTRIDVRRTLRHQLETFDGVRILVTHDPIDAYALADRVIVLDHGAVVQEGTISDVTAHPRSAYVADLVGTNLISGVIEGGVLHTPAGAAVVVADALDGDAFAVVRPQSITLSTDPDPHTSARNSWRGRIVDVAPLGDRVRVGIDGDLPLTAEVTMAALDALTLRVGDEIHATVKATDVATYPR